MRGGILIVGSLLWDRARGRESWRQTRLAMDEILRVKVPIRYGRKSESRGNTFTMVVDTQGPAGQAAVVPCRRELNNTDDIIDEAKLLWRAEQSAAQAGSISSSWGSVGARFRDGYIANDHVQAWSDCFHGGGTTVPPVNDNGILEIAWPVMNDGLPIDFDLILATATQAESNRPQPHEIADAWIDQDDGHESYFFENVRHGIRTSEDILIWRRIEERRLDWLQMNEYAQAIDILRQESM